MAARPPPPSLSIHTVAADEVGYMSTTTVVTGPSSLHRQSPRINANSSNSRKRPRRVEDAFSSITLEDDDDAVSASFYPVASGSTISAVGPPAFEHQQQQRLRHPSERRCTRPRTMADVDGLSDISFGSYKKNIDDVTPYKLALGSHYKAARLECPVDARIEEIIRGGRRVMAAISLSDSDGGGNNSDAMDLDTTMNSRATPLVRSGSWPPSMIKRGHTKKKGPWWVGCGHEIAGDLHERQEKK